MSQEAVQLPWMAGRWEPVEAIASIKAIEPIELSEAHEPAPDPSHFEDPMGHNPEWSRLAATMPEATPLPADAERQADAEAWAGGWA